MEKEEKVKKKEEEDKKKEDEEETEKRKLYRRRRNSKTRSNAKHGVKRNLDEWTKAKKEAYIELGESVLLSHSESVELVWVMLY
jgi:hypothetical protein